MPTQKKISQVEELKQRIERATITVSADYRGLRVQEMQQMRRRLRAAGIDVKVIKNNLLRLAADQTGRPDLMQIIEGPTALVLAYEDPIEAAKAVTEYAQSAPPTFSLRGAFLDGHVVSAADLRELVRLPPRPILLAQLAGQFQAPLATLVTLLESPLRELTSLLQSALSELPGLIEARIHQLQASGEPEAAPAEPEPATEESAPEETAEVTEEASAEPVTAEESEEEASAQATEEAAPEPATESETERTPEPEEEPAPEEQPESKEE